MTGSQQELRCCHTMEDRKSLLLLHMCKCPDQETKLKMTEVQHSR